MDQGPVFEAGWVRILFTLWTEAVRSILTLYLPGGGEVKLFYSLGEELFYFALLVQSIILLRKEYRQELDQRKVKTSFRILCPPAPRLVLGSSC